MTSCVKDKVTEVNTGNAIDFRVATTRAVDITTANISEFEVTALKGTETYFDKVLYSKDEAYFVSTPPYYWPADDSELTFYAYAPKETSLGGATVTINNTTKTVANFVPSKTVASQVDLVTTDATVGKKSTNESTGCPLVFKHRLSKIVVAAKNSNTGYTVKVDGVRLVVPNNAGTLDLGTALWTLTAAKGTYEHTGSAQTLSATAADMTATLGCNSFMLLPQTLTDWDGENDPSNASGGAYLALRVNIVSSGGTQLYPSTASAYDWAAVGIATTWEAGKCYKYVLDFTTGAGRVYPEKPTPVAPDTFDAGDLILGSPIKFTVTVKEWVTGTDIDVTM